MSTIRLRGQVRAIAALLAMALIGVLSSGCGGQNAPATAFGATQAPLGDTQEVLGWRVSVANLRFAAGHVLIDVDATAIDSAAPRASAADLRFGLYGALAHPIEATGLGSCDRVLEEPGTPLAAVDPDRISGMVCLGPISDQAQVRGVYVYSPRDRIADSTVAYPAAFPVGLLPTNVSDTGITVTTTSVEAWRADGTPLTPESLGVPAAFAGKGSMLLGLRADAVAADYREASERRGGPLMLLVNPTLPPPGVSPACSVYGGSVLLLPDTSRSAVAVSASLCTQGELTAALLYATVSIAGTHAAVWTRDTDR